MEKTKNKKTKKTKKLKNKKYGGQLSFNNNLDSRSLKQQNKYGIEPKLNQLYTETEFIKFLLKYLLIRDKSQLTDVLQKIQNRTTNHTASTIMQTQEMDAKIKSQINKGEIEDKTINYLKTNLSDMYQRLYIAEYERGIGDTRLSMFMNSQLPTITLISLF